MLQAQRACQQALVLLKTGFDLLGGLSKAVRKYALPVFIQHAKVCACRAPVHAAIQQNKMSRCCTCDCGATRHTRTRRGTCGCNTDRPIGRHCDSSTFVCVADTLGHLICVYGNYYYLKKASAAPVFTSGEAQATSGEALDWCCSTLFSPYVCVPS